MITTINEFRKLIKSKPIMENNEVAVLDMRETALGIVREVKDSLDFASAKLYELSKMSNDIKAEYPELAQHITDTVEPMMTELEQVYPDKLRNMMKKFHR